MTTVDSAIELPTSRQSKYFGDLTPDVLDPNYIPVLNGAEIKVDFSKPAFSALPSIPTPHANPSQSSLKRSPSGSAPETVIDYSGTQKSSRSLTKVTTIPRSPQEIGSSWGPAARHGSSRSISGRSAAGPSEGSTCGQSQAGEEQVFMIPGNTVPRPQDVCLPTVPHSTKSSISSSRRVPTSKFNNRPASIVPSMPSNSLHHQIKTPSPAPSRGASPDSVTQQSQSTSSPPPPPAPIPAKALEMPLPPLPPASPKDSPRMPISAAKSTASQRRNRALHSHPSNQSMKSRRNSVTDTDETPSIDTKPATTEIKPATPRTRSDSIVYSRQATPAPQSPLPDLPPGAVKRPPTRERAEKTATTPQLPSSMATSPQIPQTSTEHMDMADFMMNKKSMVFRRFDNMHVKLLLQLQDEIASLEKEIVELEQSSGGSEKLARKGQVMRELRKALAEYDHLFANWATMQANQASMGMKEELSKWLQTPAAGRVAMSKGAGDDLAFLRRATDLSVVSIDPEKRPTISPSIPRPESSQNTSRGFLSLFSCAGKRR